MDVQIADDECDPGIDLERNYRGLICLADWIHLIAAVRYLLFDPDLGLCPDEL